MRHTLPAPGEKIHYPFRRLVADTYTLLVPYRAKFWLASFLRLIADIAWLYPAYAFAEVVTILSHYREGLALNRLWWVIGLWIAATALRHLGVFCAKKMCYEVAEQVTIDVQLKTLHHMAALDLAWHEKENTGNKLKRIENAAHGFNRILRIWVNNIIEIAVNFVGMLFIFSRFDWFVTTFVFVYIVTYTAIARGWFVKIGEAVRQVNAQEEAVEGLLFESLNNIRTVKVLGMVSALFSKVHESTDMLIKKLRRRILYIQGWSTCLTLWSQTFRIGGIIFIVFGVTQGHYEVGFLILFNGYFNNIWESVAELSEVSQDIFVSSQSIARMKAILDEPVRIDSEKGKKRFPSAWKKVALENVSFAYGENKVLDEVSFEIPRGEKVGVVGLSGAGKSTLFKLLLKEYEGFGGQILIDDVSLIDVKKSDFFKHVAVVLQDTEVFNFSLRDNITLANPSRASDTGLLARALAVAHVKEFASSLPSGLETLIGEKGVKLSGGQKQRLGIARAIFKDPQILFLDEATSHLDLESEEKIRDSLAQFFENVTAVVIAHRLTTIRQMDRIVVMEGGRVLEIGTFDELYARKGRFWGLWEKQRL